MKPSKITKGAAVVLTLCSIMLCTVFMNLRWYVEHTPKGVLEIYLTLTIILMLVCVGLIILSKFE